MTLRIALLCGVALACAARPAAAQDTVGRQEILFDLSQTEKMLADEAFINGDVAAARTAYASAQANADLVKPDFGLVRAPDIALLQDELRYRQALLANGASFWGFEQRLKPINPMAGYRRFEAALGRYDELVGQIDGLVQQLRQNSQSDVDHQLGVLQESERSAVSALQSNAADINFQNAAIRRAFVRDRMDAIRQRQVAITEQRGPLLDRMDAVGSSMNAVLLDAATSAAGLPPDVLSTVDAAARGDVETALTGAAAAYAAGGGAKDVTGPLGEVARAAHEAASTYTELRQTYTDAQAIARASSDLLGAIQSGNTANALRLGAFLYDQLPGETKSKLTAAVSGNPKVEQLLTLARQGSALRDSVSAFLASDTGYEAALRTGLDALVAQGTGQIDTHYARMLDAVARAGTDAASRSNAVAEMVQGWAVTFVDDAVPASAVKPLATSLGVPCSDEAACRKALELALRQRGLPRELIRVDGQRVVIAKPGGGGELFGFDYAAFAGNTIKRPVELEVARAKANASALATRLGASEKAAARTLLAALPDLDFDKYFAAALRPTAGSSAPGLASSLIPPGAAGEQLVRESTAQFALGRDLLGRTAAKPAAGAPPAPGNPTLDPNQQMLLTAMAASGPYGAAASMAVKVLSGLEEMHDLADAVDRLDREDKALTVEMLHLAPLEAEIQKDEALAQVADRIARTRANGAAQRGSVLRNALVIDGATQLALQAKIASRLPLAYYYLELLRQEFAKLNQGVAQWQGLVGAGDRRLEEALRGDPRSQRLAIDPEVRLYDWFKRDSEGQRKDLDSLLQHWRQISAATAQACVAIGCATGVAELGTVEIAQPVLLSGLLATAPVRASRQWLGFTVLPQHLALPEAEGLRLVSVGGALRDRISGARSAPFNLRVRHSGVGYVMVGGLGQKETLAMSDDMAPTYMLSQEAAQAEKSRLQVRWHSPDGGSRLEPLEGYPLFGLYGLEVPPGFDLTKTDVELVFFYQRPRDARSVDARVIDGLLRCPGARDLNIHAPDLRLLLRPDDRRELLALEGEQPGTAACALAEVTP